MAATLSNRNRLLEKYSQVVREDGLNTNKNVNIGLGTATPNLWVAGNLSVGGTTSFTSDVITSTSANAFAVGANGVTNPVFNIDSSETSVATGLQVEGQAAGSGVNLETLSSGTNESLTLDAKGTGTVGINTVGTTSGLVTIGNSTSLGGLTVNGTITGNKALSVVSTNYPQITFGYTAVQNVTMGTTINGVTNIVSPNTGFNDTTVAAIVGIKGAAANTFTVGASSGSANPAFNVDTSTASQVAGISVKGAATGGTTSVTVTDTGSDSSLSIAAKGLGSVAVNPAVVAAAGGKVSSGLTFGSLAVGLFTGTGAPSFSAMNGSIYVDSNATTTTTRIYVNKSGAATAGTTWTNLTTAA